MKKEEIIEKLIQRDLKEIEQEFKIDPNNPGELRHLLYTGCRGYSNWTYQELVKELEET